MSDTPAPTERPNPYPGTWNLRSTYAITLLALMYAVSLLDKEILALVLPQVKTDLKLTDTQLGLVTGAAFGLSYAFLGLPIARLADRSSRRNLVGVAVFGWSLVTSVTGFVGNVWQLALARFLVGAGEAAGPAPAFSMIADMFRTERRASATSMLSGGQAFGAMVMLPIIGWVALHYGWRAAFLAAGLPGAILGLLILFTIQEPRRTQVAEQPPLWPSIKALCRNRTFLILMMGGISTGVSLQSSVVWTPTFLSRVHHLDAAQIGLAIGIMKGLVGVAGALLGGVLTDYLVRRDRRWLLWVPTISCLAILPLELLFLFAGPLWLSLLALGAVNFLVSMRYGPFFASIQSVTPGRVRALGGALFFMLATLSGQVIGPVVIGMLNDQFAYLYGQEAIRYSLIVAALTSALGGVIFLVASFSLPADMDSAEAV